MSLVTDVLQALDRLDWWRTLRALPDRMAALEARMAEIDAGRAPGTCPKCGKGPMRVDRIDSDHEFNDINGTVWRHMSCEPCTLTIRVPYRPSQPAPQQSPAR